MRLFRYASRQIQAKDYIGYEVIVKLKALNYFTDYNEFRLSIKIN